MADTEMLLWVDTESTGLLEDYVSPTFLEFSWTLTDPAGMQLVPLSQAFTALRPGVGGGPTIPSATAYDPTVDDSPTIGFWERDTYPVARVREMHDENGLTTEHARMQENQPDRILWSWDELERLILDDLRNAGFYELEARTVKLAGGGVAHYEQRFLPESMPRVFGDRRMHYRTHDVSQILGGLRTALLGEHPEFPGTADHLIGTQVARDSSTGWGLIGLSGTRYDADDRNGNHATAPYVATPRWADMERDNHRAAVGVARALMAHRLLPELLPLPRLAPSGE